MQIDKVQLGKTGFFVSRLCFGSLTIGPLQANLSPKDGAEVICAALDYGVNFIDTAEIYGTYPHIKALGKRNNIYLATKCYAYTKEQAETSLKMALSETGRSHIDIFLLHEQESEHTLRGHWDALEYFIQAKKQGLIRAVGISTHFIAGVQAAAALPEIDVIHPIFNIDGIGIADGTISEMECALRMVGDKGIYTMKALGGGSLITSWNHALKFVLEKPYIHSIAVGMQSQLECQVNCDFFINGSTKNAHKLLGKNRRLLIEDHCIGCGECVNVCKNKALSIKNERASVDKQRCAVCGYCVRMCREFCLKII